MLAVGLTAVFATAGRLSPDARGFGTHEQLGLSPCPILKTTGRPCPTCGMTTSFAWFVRAELIRSARANPAGCLLAAVGLALIPWLIVASSTGRTPFVRSPGTALMGLAVAAAAVTALAAIVGREMRP